MPKSRSRSHPARFLALAALSGVALALVLVALAPERVLALRRTIGLASHGAQPLPAPGGYADAVARAAPAVVNIYADRVIIEPTPRSEEHTSELQSLMRTSYAVFCLNKKKRKKNKQNK